MAESSEDRSMPMCGDPTCELCSTLADLDNYITWLYDPERIRKMLMDSATMNTNKEK